ncbi:oligosaccharide flippase family protein [Candidatus Omnitrophota bacterium]
MNIRFVKVKDVVHKKFTKDVIINLTSSFVIASSGILINTLIGKYYGAHALGIYNSALAIYLIISIISVVGIPTSILKYSAETGDNSKPLNEAVSSGLILIATTSCITTFIFYKILQFNLLPIGNNLHAAIKTMLPAIPFFALNKGFRSFLNGIRQMKFYAFFESLRWLIISAFTISSVISGNGLLFIFSGFLVAESFLLIILISYTRRYFKLQIVLTIINYIEHLKFGFKTSLSGSISIINNKIDILMIAYFTSQYYVGIYSLASEITKGLLLLSSVVQINFNPIISDLTSRSDISQLEGYIKKIRRVMLIVVSLVVICAIILFPLYILYIMQSSHYYASIPIFYILLFGVGLASLFLWCGSIPSMAGFPEDSIKRSSILILSTIVLNLILIPSFGITGAAIAVSCAYIIRLFTLRYYVLKRLGIKLF